MRVLGIETSCDDTAAAVLAGDGIRSSVVSSQDAVHGPYGGIVPEIASRHHVENVLPVVHAALEQAQCSLAEIDGIAVTCGPGLVGSLLVGLSFAKGVALSRGIPFVGVNHLEGHLLAIFLERKVEFPYLALLVSGGHTSLVLAEGLGRYRAVGQTRDDAAGEAFDKAAILLGLGFPGGRKIDLLAREGDPAAIRFPRAVVRDRPHDFSFSGLKTALREYLRGSRTHLAPGRRPRPGGAGLPEGAELADVAASFQEAVVDVLVERTFAAAAELGASRVVVSGGVSANSRLRARMEAEGREQGADVFVPSIRFCTDNAAMIAWAGRWRLECGERSPLDLNASASLRL